MSADIQTHTVDSLAEEYKICCDISKEEAIKNAEHVINYVLAVDENSNIRRKGSMLPFCWLKHLVTDNEKFQAYREHLRTHSGQTPEWAKTEGFGCQITIIPFLNKGEESTLEFYIPILLEPMGVQDASGKIALSRTKIIDWQDKSNTIS